jgi:protein O-mannosyl-transferase
MKSEKAPERCDWPLALILAALTVAAYWPVAHAGFIWDDDRYVTENPLLTAPDGLRRIWLSFDSPSQYFPLTYTTFFIERYVWGLNPAGYHWVNLLLHAANALLVWRVLARLRVPGAWLAAAIFALHPVQVESVAWITERKNVLMGLFFLLALWAWVRFTEEQTKRPWRFYGLALVFYALALAAKTTACTLPAALLLVLWLKKMPIQWRRLAQVAPFVMMGIGMGLVTVWWERYHQGTAGKLFAIGPVERALIASRAFWFYLGKLFWPTHLAFSYPRWANSASDPRDYGWLLAIAVLAVGIWRLRRRAGRGVEVAVVYFAAVLSPVLGFIMLYTFMYSFVADHYQYLACIGPIALAAAGMQVGWERLAAEKLSLGAVLAAVLLAVLGGMTWRQCSIYSDPETLWQATLTQNPDSWLAHNNLGTIFRQKGRVTDAIAQYQAALKFAPDNESICFNLGRAFYQEGNAEQAIAQFQHALQIEPGDIEAQNNLAWLLATARQASLRNGARAVQLARQANEMANEKNPVILGTLAAALAETGQFADAARTAQKAIGLAQAEGRRDLAGRFTAELERYEAGRPLHE